MFASYLQTVLANLHSQEKAQLFWRQTTNVCDQQKRNAQIIRSEIN